MTYLNGLLENGVTVVTLEVGPDYRPGDWLNRQPQLEQAAEDIARRRGLSVTFLEWKEGRTKATFTTKGGK